MSKGKCFSGVNRGQRNKSDFYQTPYSMTEQLLEYEDFDDKKLVLEPACGKGAIIEVLKKHFNLITGSDVLIAKEYDFLNAKTQTYGTNNIDYIITNPPFSLAFEFIQKAKEVASEKFAMLLPLSYLHGQKRYESQIFTDAKYPLTKVYVFTRYPLLTDTVREDGKYNTGMQVYAWFIWEKNKNICRLKGKIGEALFSVMNDPVIKWIDNNKYVLRKGK